jgi:hypothetical protein
MPELWIGYSENERSTASSRSGALDGLRMWLVDCYFDCAAGISTTVYSNIDCESLVIVSRMEYHVNLFRSCLRLDLVSPHAQSVRIRAKRSARCHCRACTRSFHRGPEFASRLGPVPCLACVSILSRWLCLVALDALTHVRRIVYMNDSGRIKSAVVKKVGFSDTHSSFEPFATRYGVTSNVNSKYPPVLTPTLWPFTNTVV